MIIKNKNVFGTSKFADYEPGSVFEFRAEQTTKFNGFWLVVGRDIKNRNSLPGGFWEDLCTLEENNDNFLANNIFAIQLETGEPCFFEVEDLACMRKVKAVVEID